MQHNKELHRYIIQEQKLCNFVYVCVQQQRSFQDLSTYSLNGIAVSGQYVSSPLVVIQARLYVSSAGEACK